MAEPTSAAGRPVKSADRTLLLLEYVAGRGSVSFNDVVSALDLPRSSAHGLLRTLTDPGWLTHDPVTKRFSLGLRTWQIGQAYEGHQELVTAARPVMDELCDQLGETVQLARLDGIENVYVAISESRNPMRLVSRVGMRLHAPATGIGKALLSTLEPDDAERRLREAPLPALTPHTVTDVDELLRLLGSIREQGFALDDEEYISGCRCVAVPLTTDLTAGMASAMSVTMPTSRTTQAWPDDLVPALTEAAATIRATLGAATPVPRQD